MPGKFLRNDTVSAPGESRSGASKPRWHGTNSGFARFITKPPAETRGLAAILLAVKQLNGDAAVAREVPDRSHVLFDKEDLAMDHHQIHEHMEVLGSDGKHIGTVDHLEGENRIKLAKKDLSAGGKHHFIPVNWVDHVDEKVHLAKTTLEAIAQWETEQAQPQQQGDQPQAGKARK